jgi:hypothetical protein
MIWKNAIVKFTIIRETLNQTKTFFSSNKLNNLLYYIIHSLCQ